MTSFAPLIEAPFAVQLHTGAALAALVLGPVVIVRRLRLGGRDRGHRVAGYVWIAVMLATALSSFWIRTMPLIGPFGPIHALSLLTLGSLTVGTWAAITRRIALHRRTMQALYLWGLLAAGIFTLWPGRIMARILFDGAPVLGWLALAALLAGWLALRRNLARTNL